MIKNSISKKQLREFGFLIGFGFPIIIGCIIPLLFEHQFQLWTLWIGFLGLILGLTSPRLLSLPYKIWMALGEALGWINSYIILGLVYILVLLPIAFALRLTGYDPLKIKQKGKKTYRKNLQDHNPDLTRIF